MPARATVSSLFTISILGTDVALTVIISTRGTTEAQGPSAGFVTLIKNTLAKVSGGVEYDTVYPAAADQISTAAVTDVSVFISNILIIFRPNIFTLFLDHSLYQQRSLCLPEPKVCSSWIFARYVARLLLFNSKLTVFASKGAAATTDYLKTISTTSAAGAAIKAVFLIGNPERIPGKKANVDEFGGQLTATAIGLEAGIANAGIPSAWDSVSKVLDVCYEVREIVQSSISLIFTYNFLLLS